MVCLISRCPKTCVKKSTSSWAPDAQTVTWWKPDTKDMLLYLRRDYINCDVWYHETARVVSIYQQPILHARAKVLAFSDFPTLSVSQCSGPQSPRPACVKAQFAEVIDKRYHGYSQH